MTPKIAIVHDWLNQDGGAEKVLEVLHDMYPEAPIFTSIYTAAAMPEAYRRWDIRTSFMQGIPLVKRHHQPLLPLYPFAFERFDLSSFDAVISNSSGFCHGVVTQPETCHINYCLTPPRYIWNLPQYLQRERVNPLARKLLPFVIAHLRNWDAMAASRVDYFVGISQAVVARIRKFYRREAALIYPPVDTHRFEPSTELSDYFLVTSRLVPYKRVDIVVQAFNRLGLPLLVVGDGRDRAALQAMAEPNIKFTGQVPFQDLKHIIARCRAFIFPGEEDFGIAPVEAQATGRPVIAYAAGGALETVINDVTGIFFLEQTPEALMEAVHRFDDARFDPHAVREYAYRFDTEVFKSRFGAFVIDKTKEYARVGSGLIEKA